ARSAVRQALADWGMGHLSVDAELLASELVANAAEHGDGRPIGLALRRHAEPGEQPGITCEITDGSPAMPRPREPGPDRERGRGAQLTTREADRGSGMTVRDLEPLTGARAARDIELGARHVARDYIRQAREAGHGWEQIGQALGVAPNADADQAGLTVAEAA